MSRRQAIRIRVRLPPTAGSASTERGNPRSSPCPEIVELTIKTPMDTKTLFPPLVAFQPSLPYSSRCGTARFKRQGDVLGFRLAERDILGPRAELLVPRFDCVRARRQPL
jgi:hypothetical protein